MVQFRTRVYDKEDNAGFVGADVIIQSDTDVENIITITDETIFDNLDRTVKNLHNDYVKFDDNSLLKGSTIDTILKNSSNATAINAKTLSGKSLSYFSPLNHTHTLTNITDLYKYEIKLVDANGDERYNFNLNERISLEFRVFNSVTGKGVSNVSATIKSIPTTMLPEQTVNTNSSGLARARNITLNMSGIVTFVITTPSSIERIQCTIQNPRLVDDWKEVPLLKTFNPDLISAKLWVFETMRLANLEFNIPYYLGWCAEKVYRNVPPTSIGPNNTIQRKSIGENKQYVNNGGSKTYNFFIDDYNYDTHYVVPEDYCPKVPLSQTLFKGEWSIHLDTDGSIYGSAMSYTSEGSNLSSTTNPNVTSNWSIDLRFNQTWHY